MLIRPVVLSGGSGTRLWPLSRASLPKQFLNIHGQFSLFQHCLRGVSTKAGFDQPAIICSRDHRFIVEEQVEKIGVQASRIVLEPMGKNTGPAVAISALLAAEANPEDIIAVLPSDTLVEHSEALADAVKRAADAARLGYLAVIGVRPVRPETGFGYVEVGEPLGSADSCHRAASFVEKPSLEIAQQLVQSSRYLWNCGTFVFSAKAAIDAFSRYCPEVLAGAKTALARSSTTGSITTLSETDFGAIQSISFDKAVLEKADRLAIAELRAGWSDLGSWHAVSALGQADEDGNTTVGNVVALDVSNSYLRSDGPLVAAVGVEDLFVIATDDSVLVADAAQTQDVKKLVEEMAAKGRTEHLVDKTVFRPWGHYKELDQGNGFRVKLVFVKPGGALSLQRHRHRSEHWVIVSGTAQVTRGTEVFTLQPNESTFIPQMTVHRLENRTTEPLNLIEVQTGAILEESDIERFSDVYGRVEGSPQN